MKHSNEENCMTILKNNTFFLNYNETYPESCAKKCFSTLISFIKCQSQIFTLSLFLISSILINSIYFNLFYLPSLNNQQHFQHNKQLEKIGKENIEPHLPYLSYVNQENVNNNNFKSLDHVIFPTIINHNQHHQHLGSKSQENDLVDKNYIHMNHNPEEYTPSSSIGFNIYDVENEDDSIHKTGNFKSFC